jgi:hypothetical protein
MYNRKEKEKEFLAHHAEVFALLKIPNPVFVLKTAFFQTGKYGRNIQLFDGELNKNEDIYVEFVDIVRDEETGKEIDLVPMSPDRQLFKFKANPFYAEEYEVKENPKYTAYTIPASELIAILKDGSEISYSLYEKRKVELQKTAESLPRLQQSLAPALFPDFEQDFQKVESSVEMPFDIEKASVISEDAPLSEITIRDLAAIMLMKPVSNRSWLNELIKQSKSDI